MTERDAFEARLHAAVHAHVAMISSDLDAVELAHSIAGAAPRRRGIGAVLGRQLALVPRAAWLLLIVGALVALVSVALIAGAHRPDGTRLGVVPPVAVAVCPPGSTPDQQGPTGQPRPNTAGWGAVRMAFDRLRAQVIGLVSSDGGSTWQTWTFDVCRNSWSRPEPASEPEGRVLSLVYAAREDRLIAFGEVHVWAYDPGANRWTRERDGPPTWGSAAVYDPNSGSVYALLGGGDRTVPQGLWSYDPATDAWTQVPQSGEAPAGGSLSNDHVLFAFDTAADRIVAVDTERPWQPARMFDPRTGTWTESGAVSPTFNTGYFALGGEIAFDEAARRTVVFADGKVGAFDAGADGWITHRVGTGSGRLDAALRRFGHSMVYDPVNRRLVVAGGTYRWTDALVQSDDVFAINPDTGEPTELLAPSHVEFYDMETEAWQPMPTPGEP